MKSFRNSILIPLFFTLSGGAIVVNTAIAQEQTQEQSRTYFIKAPRLLTAATTFSGVRVRGAKYYFNIVIPEDAGNDLQQVAIRQRKGQEDIEFRLEKTVAYRGTNRDKGAEIAIANITQNEQSQEIIVTFENPIAPGTAFTVGLKPRRNPDYAGVYVFGVTAIPQGNNPTPLYLGAKDLRFYHGGDFRH